MTAAEFAISVADYVETHHDYENLTKRQVVIEAMFVLMTDPGAAQSFLDVIGLEIDLDNPDEKE